MNRFETIRGGEQKRITLSDFADRTRGKAQLPFVVEKIILPELGEPGWGEVVIRTNATRRRRNFRRD